MNSWSPQGARSVGCLHELRDFFGIGAVVVNRRSDDHREPLHRYVVRRRQDLLDVVIPLFRRYPLRSAKREDFEKFAACVVRMQNGEHLSNEGLASIAEVIGTMNRRKPRDDLIRILRGHTPEP